MSIASALTALCEMLRAQTGVDVILGRPEGSTSTIYIWPWGLDEVVAIRNRPSPVNPGESRVPQTSAQNIHFLVMATPALTTEGLSLLAQARQTIGANPVLRIGGVDVQVLREELDVELLTSLFQSSGIPLTLCLSAVMRGVP